MAQNRSWCFTLFFNENVTTLSIDHDFSNPAIRYVSYQYEICPTTQRRHAQGYVEFNRAFRISGVKGVIPKLGTAHLERRNGTRDQARDYTTKEETRAPGEGNGPFQKGEWEAGGQGARSDVDAYAKRVKELVAEGLAPADRRRKLGEEMPGTHMRFRAHAEGLAADLAPVVRDEGFVPRRWQQRILDLCATVPDDRTVYWVRDTNGAKGKSRLALHMIMNHGAVNLRGNFADMCHIYEGERVVIFDITRAMADYKNDLYSMAEVLKNGFLTSTKYQGAKKVFKKPHVIFFSNYLPTEGLWSGDRVKLIDLDRPEVLDPVEEVIDLTQ